MMAHIDELVVSYVFPSCARAEGNTEKVAMVTWCPEALGLGITHRHKHARRRPLHACGDFGHSVELE